MTLTTGTIDPAKLAFARDYPPGARVDLRHDARPEGYCQCGCGGETATVKYADASKGLVRGQRRRYLKGHQIRNAAPHFEVNEDGCWEWLHAIQVRGYGVLRGRLAHRVIYEAVRGPIPEGLQIDHLCENKRCVNPWHLEAVTLQENLRRYYEGRVPA